MAEEILMETYSSIATPLVAEWARWMFAMSIQIAVLTGIIWLITRFTPKSSASFRYALWLLVFAKLILPPSLEAPWSAASLVDRVTPIEILREDTSLPLPGANSDAQASPQDSAVRSVHAGEAHQTPSAVPPTSVVVMVLWLIGAAGLIGTLTLQARRFRLRILKDHSAAPSNVLNLAHDIADRLQLRNKYSICVSSQIKIPVVTGLRHPTVVIPETLVSDLSQTELSDVIGHELAHVKRHDILFGWLTTLLLGCYWFHPAVWLAHIHLRREREMASDDTVLYATRQEGRRYASTIVRMARDFDETAPAGAGLLGILEIADNLLHRVRSAADATRPRRMGRAASVTIALLALLLLPMAVWTPATQAAGNEAAAKAAPKVVSTEPALGDTGVDPALGAIRATFNMDMAKGFSWTGNPPLYPQTAGSPRWIDARTCELPVKLEPGKVYRLGINSTAHRNFKSTQGTPARPQVIAFVTRGGDPSLADAVKRPTVVTMSPERNANNISPLLDKLVVSFDREMAGGFSWTGSGEDYPEMTGPPSWSEDHRTCTVPVRLRPDRTYRLGLNSPSHINFQSSFGIPLKPVEWTFATGK